MKIILVVFFALISISVQAQFSEEKILEDGTHYSVYPPIHYTDAELASWKPRRNH